MSRKKFFSILFIAGIFCLSEMITVFAGNWKQEGNRWWYQHDNGSYPVNEWLQENGKWYHFDVNGYMQTGWIQEGNKWYYLFSDGSMLSNTTTPDGYYVNSDGVWRGAELSSDLKAPIYDYLPRLDQLSGGYYTYIDLDWTFGEYDDLDRGDYLEVKGSAISLEALLNEEDEIADIYNGSIYFRKDAVFRTMPDYSIAREWFNGYTMDFEPGADSDLISMSIKQFFASKAGLGYNKMKFDANGFVTDVVRLYSP